MLDKFCLDIEIHENNIKIDNKIVIKTLKLEKNDKKLGRSKKYCIYNMQWIL